MWGFLSEWLLGFVVLPWRLRAGQSVLRGVFGWLFGIAILAGVATERLVFAVIPLLVVVFGSLNVASAYRALERAAVLDLDDPQEAPLGRRRRLPFFSPTARSLFSLALVVDAVRRGQTRLAETFVGRVDQSLLRAPELRLFEAARALVLLGQGEKTKASQKAIAALPTGSEDLDLLLGRLVVESAWGTPIRLFKIDDAWRLAGVPLDGGTSLSWLRRLIGLRLSEAEVEQAPLSRDELRALAVEAHAVGDETLAHRLEAASREVRGYRS